MKWEGRCSIFAEFYGKEVESYRLTVGVPEVVLILC